MMDAVPHRLIEGCLIAAHAIESKDVFIYIRGEYLAEYEIGPGAVDEAEAAGLFGDVRRRRPPRRRRVHLRRGDGAARVAGGASAASRARGRRSRRCRASTTRRPR